MRIAVDTMGGDNAPVRIIQGCLLASEMLAGETLVLVGDSEQIQSVLDDAGADLSSVEIVHAPDTIGMDEHPVEALRTKPNASIPVAVGLVASGKADAVVSAGNTGAMVAAASMMVRTLPGVKRPGIAVPMPTAKGFVTLMDAGANMSCRAGHLLQYGLIGSEYASRIYGIERPRIGLLNVGAEATKGTELIQAAHAMLSDAPIHYVGSVEGHDLFTDMCDVALTDGFTGNCILKANEGFAHAMLAKVGAALSEAVDAATAKKVIQTVVGTMDFSEYGGAPLLGINGTVVIAHGRSNERAIANAIKQASSLAHSGLNDQIVKDMSALSDAGA